MEIVIATRNAGKLREIARIMAPIVCRSHTEIASIPDLDAVETGATYLENAEMKARRTAGVTGGIVAADDSGLEVDALGGRPGVMSARYGGHGLSDEERCALLLRELEGTPAEGRGARFVCVAAVVFPDGTLKTFMGECRGTIAFSPAGSNGFGYDPVFFVPRYGKTIAELTAEAKDGVSHRGEAFGKVREWLLRAGGAPGGRE
ncbi:MAG: RdgB/HAM1 family non-canonical purine NTP pyrophosphatase [bacterium]